MTKLISIITGILTLTVAGFAFAVSFTSLTEMAHEYNFPIPFLLPLTLEAGMIVFSANALYRKLNKESTKWQWSLVIFSSLTALIFNVLHATQIEDKALISKVMFAVPSLFLLLAFENLLSQVNHIIKKSTAVASIKELQNSLLILRQEFEAKGQTLNEDFESIKEELELKIKTLNEEFENKKLTLSKMLTELEDKIKAKTDRLNSIEVLARDKNTSKKDNRQKLILQLIKTGEGSLENLRQSLGVSYPTISGDIKELESEGMVYKDGGRWKLNGKHSSH